VPSALVAVPATVKVLSFDMVLPFKKVAYHVYKKCCTTAQHTIIIAKDDILVNHFLHNFGRVCPFYWANSLLCVWMVWTPLSAIRAMPEKPTEATTKPNTKPIKIFFIAISPWNKV
jgi:hypothetical protein